MKKWYPEHYKFKITVMSVGDDGNPQHCRNGHEVGDTYECGYGCPGGFCSKTSSRLFTIQEAIRSNGDLRLLIAGAKKHSCEIPCADHVVTFKIEAELNYTIRLLGKEHLPIYADIIRKSFATVAQDFGWTKDNVPGHVSFRNDDQLASKQEDCHYPFGLFVDKTLVGFVSLTDIGSNGSYELNRLSVLPSWRHIGYGKKLLDFCKEKVRELGGNKIILDLIEENTVLKNWYAANGFVHTGTKSSRICRLRRVIWSGRQRNELHIPKSHARGCSLSHYLYKHHICRGLQYFTRICGLDAYPFGTSHCRN